MQFSFSKFVANALLAFAASHALAQTYPSLKPITLLSGAPVGSAVDLAVRPVGDELANELSQKIVIDARPVANGAVAGEALIRSAPDGYTLLFGYTVAIVINSQLIDKGVRWNPVKDMTPIAEIGTTASLIVVRNGSATRSLADMLQAAKVNPGSVRIGLLNFSLPHFVMLGMKRGEAPTLVPYSQQGQLISALLAGDVEAICTGAGSLMPFIQSAKMTAIGVVGGDRYAELPEVPSLQSIVPSTAVENWYAIFAPAGMDTRITQHLNRAINAILKKPKLVAQLAAAGVTPSGGTSDKLKERVNLDFQRYGEIIKASGLKSN